MVGYNERKLSVLDAIEVLGEVRAWDIAEYLEIDIWAARKALSRYRRQGLLYRSWGLYWLSDKGLERLEYLLESNQ
jgi:Mn-dependent DtxR family transcriptional regulator